ncbi:MAG: DUF1963 domain-containing protein, partial [Gammaproteobacteria bacterium]|nr:DUF1963 domain-containing protein [Gammaproteobacteria bacterium]
DTTHTYAYSSAIGCEDKLDLIKQLTIPWQAENFNANQYLREKPGQADIFGHSEDMQRSIGLEATPSYSFPDHICAGDNQCVLIANENQSVTGDGEWGNQDIHRQRIYRLVNCVSGTILLEKKLAGVDHLDTPRSIFDIAKKPNVLQQFNQVGIPVAVDPETKTALFSTMQGYQIKAVDENLSILHQQPNDFLVAHPLGVWSTGKYVANYGLISGKTGLIVINPKTGQIEQTFDFGKKTISSLAGIGESGQIVCGLHGGEFYRIDIVSGKITKFKSHRGVSAHCSVDVRVSGNAELIASTSDESLCLTSTVYGKTHRMMSFESVVHDNSEANGKRLVFSPDFYLLGEKLAILSEQTLSLHELLDLQSVTPSFVSELGHPNYKKPHKYSAKLDLIANFEKAGLARVAPQLESLWSNSLILKTTRKARPLPVCESKLGGYPDLPDGFTWPMYQGEPLAFMGQLNLERLALQLPDSLLPKQGILAFFLSDTELGIEATFTPSKPGDQRAWQVYYFPSISSLTTSGKNQVVPDGENVIYSQASLKFSKKGRVMPEVDSMLIDLLCLSDAEKEDYFQFVKQIPKSYYDHQLLGYPGLIQNDSLEMECEMFTNSLEWQQFSALEGAEKDGFKQSASEWILLLQLSSDNKLDWLWGDAGNLYWMIRRGDLKAQRFDQVQVIMQCS